MYVVFYQLHIFNLTFHIFRRIKDIKLPKPSSWALHSEVALNSDCWKPDLHTFNRHWINTSKSSCLCNIAQILLLDNQLQYNRETIFKRNIKKTFAIAVVSNHKISLTKFKFLQPVRRQMK